MRRNQAVAGAGRLAGRGTRAACDRSAWQPPRADVARAGAGVCMMPLLQQWICARQTPRTCRRRRRRGAPSGEGAPARRPTRAPKSAERTSLRCDDANRGHSCMARPPRSPRRSQIVGGLVGEMSARPGAAGSRRVASSCEERHNRIYSDMERGGPAKSEDGPPTGTGAAPPKGRRGPRRRLPPPGGIVTATICFAQRGRRRTWWGSAGYEAPVFVLWHASRGCGRARRQECEEPCTD